MPALHVLWAFPCKKKLAGKDVKLPVFTGYLLRFLLHLDLLKEANKNNTHTYIYIFLYRFPISSGFWHWENAKFIIHKKHILLIIEIIIMIFPPFSANSKSRLHVLPAAG